MERSELPLEVREDVWKIVEEFQKIIDVPIEYDPTWNNGKVTKNVSAQFVLNDIGKPSIVYYTKKISEQTIAHEILHAKRIINKFFILRNNTNEKVMSTTIVNFGNVIEHIIVYEWLKKLGFNIRLECIKGWKEFNDILTNDLNNPKTDISKKLLKLLGTKHMLSGIINGVDITEIKEKSHPKIKKYLHIGEEIYNESKKYDLENHKENFEFLLKLSSILNLTTKEARIQTGDFESGKFYYLDPTTGKSIGIFSTRPIA